MDLSERQREIIKIVKEDEPISSKEIAEKLGISRAAIRTDLSVLTKLNILEAKPKVGYFYIQGRNDLDFLDRLFNMPVKEIMSMPVIIKEDVSIYDAIVTMFLEDVGTIFVINEKNRLSGVISRKDLLKMSIGQNDLHKTPVSLAMTRMPNIITIGPEDSYFEAARRISINKIDSLPVVDNKLKVIGRFSKTNIASTLVEYRFNR